MKISDIIFSKNKNRRPYAAGRIAAHRKGRMNKWIAVVTLLSFTGPFGFVQTAIPQEQEIAGTFFGDPVPKENYFFILRVVLSISSPWGGIPNNREQLERRVWDDLILSYEAHRRGISVERKELEEKIGEMLKGDQVAFDWTKDPGQYAQWVKEKLGTPVKVFENHMQHVVQIRKFHQQVLDSINPTVTEKEAFEEFLNEYNSLSVELAEFDGLEEAQAFYEDVLDDPDVWEQFSIKDKERAAEDRSFQRPGFVTLEFLMDMWKFPREAVFEMITMKIGDIHTPAPIYEGYGVFKILDIRRADESEFPQRKESYYDQLRSKKKYQGFHDWLDHLKKEADMQVYIEPPGGIFP